MVPPRLAGGPPQHGESCSSAAPAAAVEVASSDAMESSTGDTPFLKWLDSLSVLSATRRLLRRGETTV